MPHSSFRYSNILFQGRLTYMGGYNILPKISLIEFTGSIYLAFELYVMVEIFTCYS